MVWPDARPAAGRTGPLRLPVEWPVTAAWMLIAAGLVAVVIFDLSPPLAFNDDWMYA